MRTAFVVFLLICSGLSGCFGDDESSEEKRGKPGGLALACLQDDKFEKMKIHFLYEEGYDPIAMDLTKPDFKKYAISPTEFKSLLSRSTSLKIILGVLTRLETPDGNTVEMPWAQAR